VVITYTRGTVRCITTKLKTFSKKETIMSNSLLLNAFASMTPVLDTAVDLQALDSYIEAANEMNEVADAIERCDIATESLVALQADMADTLSVGGMTAPTAVMAGHAVSGVMAGLGATIPVASVESFNDAGGRMAGTEFALESIGTILEDIWDKIKEFIKTWVDKVKAFWGKHLSSAGRLAKAAKSLSEKANNTTGSKKENKLTVGTSISTPLHIGGSFSKDVQGDLDSLGELVKTSNTDETAIDLAEGLTKLFEDASVSKVSDVNDLLVEVEKADIMKKDTLSSKLTSIADNVDPNPGDYAIVRTGPNLLGNVKVSAKISTIDSTSDIVKTLKISLDNYTKDKLPKIKSDLKVDALSTNDISSVADSVETVCNILVDDKINIPKRQKAIDDLMKAVDSVVADVKNVTDDSKDATEKANNKAANSKLRKLVSGSKNIASATMEPSLSVSQQALKSAHAAYGYAAKSLSNIKK